MTPPEHGVKGSSGESSVSALVGALGEVQGIFAIARSGLSAELRAVESESELRWLLDVGRFGDCGW